jgi:phosphoglycerate dehydrogenase-like enzyme
MKLIVPTELADTIQTRLPDDLNLVWVDPDGNLDSDASDAEIYFNGFWLKPTTLHRVLAAAPQLRWQHSPSAGVNHILTPTFLARDIILTNSAGVYAIPIAEFVLAFILDRAKQLANFHLLQAQRRWSQEVEVQELAGAKLLVIGAGSIGRAIALRARAFDIQVWGVRRSPQPLPGFEQVVGVNEWRSLLPEADYVVVATPLTPETRGMIDADALRSMKSSAYLINIARGAIVDETALLAALKEGWIAGAGLDTFSTEPLPSDSPFWSLPNVFITPHCSAATPQTNQRIVDLFFDNLRRYCQGQPLKNVVDKLAGY